MSQFRTDYKDDRLLVAENTKRKYKVIENEDGTVSFEDVTAYEQKGDQFGAVEVNAIHAAINNLIQKIETGIPIIVLDEKNQIAYITTNQG